MTSKNVPNVPTCSAELKQLLRESLKAECRKQSLRLRRVGEDQEEAADEPPPDAPKGRRLRPVKEALVKCALEGSLGLKELRQIVRATSSAIVVRVPTAEWVSPVSRYLESLIEGEHFARDGTQSKRDSDTADGAVSTALAGGRNVVGVSHVPERFLPSTLTLAADVRVTIAPPTGTAIARAIRMSLRGRMPKEIPAELGRGLGFGELVSAIRPGSSPSQAVRRIQAMSRARFTTKSDSRMPPLKDATFYGAAQEWALNLVDDIAAAQTGAARWQDLDSRAVLFGATGVGKTYLARIIAHEAGLPLVETSIGELFASSPGYLDSVIKAERAVFAKAAALAPCVLFFDEVDGLPNRATMSQRGRDWWQPVVNDFLLQVSAVPENVILLAATNFIEHIDAALLRPGRFGRAIEIKPAHTAKDLAGILRFHLGNELPDANLIELAQFGLGASPAQVMEWTRAARRAARAAKRPMSIQDLKSEIVPPDVRGPEELMRSALHEAGHAVVALALGLGAVDHVSLLGSGTIGGRMRVHFFDKYALTDKRSIERYVTMQLAGRAAEKVFYGEGSAGAGGAFDSDLGVASKLISAVHTSFGLGDGISLRAEVGEQLQLLRFDRELREKVEHDLQALLGVAETIVRKHRYPIQCIAGALVERRFLPGHDLKGLFDRAQAEASATLMPDLDEGSSSEERGS